VGVVTVQRPDPQTLADTVRAWIDDVYGDDARAALSELVALASRADCAEKDYAAMFDQAAAAQARADRLDAALREYAAEEVCPDCGGDGEVRVDGGYERCVWCAGTGFVSKEGAMDGGVRARAALAAARTGEAAPAPSAADAEKDT
jgi:hypothetical protein